MAARGERGITAREERRGRMISLYHVSEKKYVVYEYKANVPGMSDIAFKTQRKQRRRGGKKDRVEEDREVSVRRKKDGVGGDRGEWGKGNFSGDTTRQQSSKQ